MSRAPGIRAVAASGPSQALDGPGAGNSGGGRTWRRLRSARVRSIGRLWLARAALAGAVVVVWQLASGRLIDPLFISSPSAIAQRLGGWLGDGTLWYNTSVTLRASVFGFLAGGALGISCGLVLGRLVFTARVLRPFIDAAYALPKIALAPLFVLWFGVGLAPKIILSAILVFFLVFYNTLNGVRDVDRDLVDVIAVMGASRRQLLQKVIVPAASSWIIAGLKIAAPYAVVGAVVGEIIASNQGLGFVIEKSSTSFDSAGVFAALIVLMVIAAALNAIVVRLEDAFLGWTHIEGAGDGERRGGGTTMPRD